MAGRLRSERPHAAGPYPARGGTSAVAGSERPHAAGPYLSLDAEKLDELILRLTTAICVGIFDQADSEELRYARQKKSGLLVDDTIKWIEERAGADLYGEEMHDRASERVQEIVEKLAAELEDEGSEGGE